MLPGARAVLFTITATTGGLDAAQVAVLDLVTRSYKVLVGGSDPRYVPGEPSSTTSAGHEIGHLVYVKGAALMAIRFDPARMEIHGTPVMVLPRLTTHPSGIGAFDVAGDGTIVYADAPSSDLTAGTLVLVDRRHRCPRDHTANLACRRTRCKWRWRLPTKRKISGCLIWHARCSGS
jgi:hypothetical protein